MSLLWPESDDDEFPAGDDVLDEKLTPLIGAMNDDMLFQMLFGVFKKIYI